jgi:hypothetical protein
VVDSLQSTVKANNLLMPSDDHADPPIYVIPRNSAGEGNGDSLVVEVSFAGTVTVTGTGSSHNPGPNCVFAVDQGNGECTVTAKTITANEVRFSAVLEAIPEKSHARHAQSLPF